MIATTTYTAESRKEEKALRMMHINLQEAGLDVEFFEPTAGQNGTDPKPAMVTIRESRRKRKSNQEVEHVLGAK